MSALLPQDALAALADSYWAFERTETPFAAVLAGEPCDEVQLFRESPADHDRRAASAKLFRRALDAIPRAALNHKDTATWDLLARELDLIAELHTVDAHLFPSLLPVGPDFNTIFYAGQVAIDSAIAAELHVERVAAFPAFLADVGASIAEGMARGHLYPRAVMAAAVAGVRRNAAIVPDASPWVQAFARGPAKADPAIRAFADRTARVVERELLPAFAEYAEFLADSVTAAARDTLSCADGPHGTAFYDVMVRRFTSLDTTATAIHAFGTAQVARLEGEAEALAGEAGYADAAAYRAFLTTDPRFVAPSAEALRERVEVLAKRIDASIPSYFELIPRITYGIDSMSPAMSQAMPPAYAQPAPSGGSAAGLFWITGLPERLRTFMLPALTMHEAWPGHLMHIGLMAELTHLPAFRRHGAVKHTACIEGWAMYCERLGADFGLYKTPHDHYGRLEGEMWRACRLVVDTGIHAFGWSRERAIAFMAERLTLPLATIEAEVDRYIALPGQALAYLVGGLKINELRARAEATLGPRFSLRVFHRTIMTAGGVTLPVLERIVDDWLAAA